MSEIHDLVAPYALNALEPEEMRSFEAHLERCDNCQLELGRLTKTTADLSMGLEVMPPPDLKRSVLAAVSEDARGQSSSAITRVPWRRRLRTVSIGVGAVTAVVIAVLAIGLTRSGDQARRAAVIEAGDATTVVLEGEGIEAQFTYSLSEEAGIFVSESLPDIEAQETYELWLIDDGGPSPAGLFIPDENGTTDLLVAGVFRGQAIGVTIEPAGGSDNPTGEVILLAEIA